MWMLNQHPYPRNEGKYPTVCVCMRRRNGGGGGAENTTVPKNFFYLWTVSLATELKGDK